MMNERQHRKEYFDELNHPNRGKWKKLALIILAILCLPIVIICFADPRVWAIALGSFLLTPLMDMNHKK